MTTKPLDAMTRQDIPENTLYAFWSYAQPPYFLGGHVTRLRADGAVETSNYGCGNWFKPAYIFPYAVGVEIQGGLTKAGDEYRDAKKIFEAQWGVKMNEVARSYGLKERK